MKYGISPKLRPKAMKPSLASSFLPENQKWKQSSDWYNRDDRIPIQYVVPIKVALGAVSKNHEIFVFVII